MNPRGPPPPPCLAFDGAAGAPTAAGAARHWSQDGVTHIDVRGMAPPQPLVAILRLIRSMPPGQVMAHLERDPVMLHPELAELGWEALPMPGEPGEVRLLLRRVA